MATITIKGTPFHTSGDLPATGYQSSKSETGQHRIGQRTIVGLPGTKSGFEHIFPSVNTGICAQSVRTFNQEAAELDNTKVLCISRDLPFALTAFCGAEGIDQGGNPF